MLIRSAEQDIERVLVSEEDIHARIREGGAADLVLFDDQTPYTVEKFHSKASNSPFVGAKLYGKVHYTICSGETVYRAE